MELTAQEREDLYASSRKLAATIWGQSVAADLNMNEDVVRVILTALNQALECSKKIAQVPDPLDIAALLIPTLAGGLNFKTIGEWLSNHQQAALQRIENIGNNRAYRACVVTAAASYRSALELASLGI